MKYGKERDNQSQHWTVYLPFLCALNLSVFFLQNRPLAYFFFSIFPKRTARGSLNTSVNQTDAILMMWILENAQFDKHSTETTEVGLLGNYVCSAPVVC